MGWGFPQQELSIPFCAIPGNHDVEQAAEDARTRYLLYGRAFGPRRYWFAYANALFVGLDTSTKRCGREDLDWLEQTLARHRSQYEACFVYTHVPPRDLRPGMQHALSQGSEELMEVLKAHRVSALFAGHIHSCLTDRIDGIPIFISGGAGGRLEGPEDRYHYMLCTVERDGSFVVDKKVVDVQPNTNYLEHAARVKLPSNTILFVSVMLLIAGAVSAVRRASTRSDGR